MDKNYFERYNSRTHTIGRVSSVIVLIMLVGAPFLIGAYLGAMPDLGAAAKAFISVGLVDGEQRCGIPCLHADARRGRRLPRIYYRQPHKYEDTLRRQRARHRRRKDRHTRKMRSSPRSQSQPHHL